MLQRISAGSSETELKLLAVTPTLRPPTAAVMIVTPVAKLPKARRKARGSKPASCWWVMRSSVPGEPGRSIREKE
ncbi:hypothetical protein D3C79_556860 [compost metagenome]